VSHAAHLAGALVGTAAGYTIHAMPRRKRDPNRRVSDPFGRTRSAKKLR
jgi:membrane associated rhomboid family serine protease